MRIGRTAHSRTPRAALAESLEPRLMMSASGFEPRQVITDQAAGAVCVRTADVDGDGDVDVLSASWYDNTIAWCENTDGAGTFGPRRVITDSAEWAKSLDAADVDGDGDVDVLSASAGDDTIAWYENTDGAGTFGPRRTITVEAIGAWSVRAADVDGDGDADVLSASQDDDTIAWYENTDGAGTFGPRRAITDDAAGAQCVEAADVDGDGDTDVLSASWFDNTIAWCENLDGAGTFGPREVITAEANWAKCVYAADVDGDGDVDVLSASADDDTIAWYENTNGAGAFGPQRTITTEADWALSVYAADVDGDGDVDVLSASMNDHTVAWYENTNGAGTFGPRRVIGDGAEMASCVHAADLDGDGGVDVLAASINDDTIAWYKNQKSPYVAVIGQGGVASATYTDADGTRATVTIAGGTATLNFAGQDVIQTAAGGRVEIGGTDIRLAGIDVTSSTAYTSLVISTWGGDNVVTLDALAGSTPLGAFVGYGVDLVGEGIRMTGDGYARTVIVHDVEDGADIVMPGQGAAAGVVLYAAELSDETRIELGSPLAYLAARQWAGGELITPWASAITITGYAWEGVRGDLGADMTFTGASAWGVALGSLYVAGEISQADLLADAGTVGSVTCAQWDQGLLRTKSVSVIQTTGSWTDPQIDGRFAADVDATDAGAAYSLVAAVIAGRIDGTWTFAAPVSLIYAAATAETWTLDAADYVTSLLVTGELAGELSAAYYTSIYAAGALSAHLSATGANVADASIVSLYVGSANDISVTVPGGIHVVILAESVDTDGQDDAVQAKWITQIVSLGEIDFNLTLSGAAPNGYALVAATILGEITGGRWDLEGNVASIYAASTGADWQLDAAGFVTSLYARTALGGFVQADYIRSAMTAGDVTAGFELTGQDTWGISLGSLVGGRVVGDVELKAAGVVNVIQVWQWHSGRIEAAGINVLMTVGHGADVGGHFGADVVLHPAAATAWPNTLGYAYVAGDLDSGRWDITGALGMLYVAGRVDGATIRTTGSMGYLFAGSFACANFLAGISADVTDHAAVAADFVDLTASIGSVTVLGAGDPNARCLTATNFSAARFGTVSVLNPDLATGETGFFAHESDDNDELLLMVYRDTATSESWVYSTLWNTPFPGPEGLFEVIPA